MVPRHVPPNGTAHTKKLTVRLLHSLRGAMNLTDAVALLNCCHAALSCLDLMVHVLCHTMNSSQNITWGLAITANNIHTSNEMYLLKYSSWPTQEDSSYLHVQNPNMLHLFVIRLLTEHGAPLLSRTWEACNMPWTVILARHVVQNGCQNGSNCTVLITYSV